LVSRDVDLLLDSFEELDIQIDSEDVDSLKDEMYAIMKETENYKLEDYSFQESINQLNSTLYRYQIRMPGSLALMIKVIAMVGDIGLTLDPEFNFIERIAPYVSNLMRQNMFSTESLEQTRNALTREILGFPKTLRKFLDKVSSGKSRMEVTVPEVAEINQSLKDTGWKLFLGLLGMGLIIGLSIIITATNILTPDILTLITLLGGVALLVIILKGVTSGSG
ncbi:MAG: hypothetical protein NWF07_09005, partial [Candidatus Bathyarchaeota archaeon]|nr:hypothetical protein [Candidatus Bathyarchaeota archaeon]